MRKVTFLKLFVGVAVLTCSMNLFAGYADMPTLQKAKFKAEELEKGTLSITRKDVDVTLKGRVRQDYLFYDKIFTLRASNDDQLTGFRTKACFDLAATYGKQTFGRSAADALLRWTNYGFWKYEGFYTPFTDGTFNEPNMSRPMELLSYIEEAWVELHFGTFFKAFDNWFSYENHPVSFKMGYFPYQLGRGISFGDMPMHIPYLGWESYGYDDTRYNHPGILIHGVINKDISYDLYYTKQAEISLHRGLTWLKPHANSVAAGRYDKRRPYRGISKDRDLWAAKMDMKHQKRWGDIHLQPYMMYVDAPELKIEVEGDSCARLGTVGMMMKYKRGKFKVNAEVATQFGHQYLHAIDRNVVEEETDLDGNRVMVNSHIFRGSNTEDKALDYDGLQTHKNKIYNRGGIDEDTNQHYPAITNNGKPVLGAHEHVSPDGIEGLSLAETLVNGSVGVLYNSDVTGNKRFRDSYRLDYRGYMGVIDVKYKFEDVPVSIAAAAAYVSGDKYPYNTEVNKRYKAFLPYGDYNYIGKYVISQLVLDAKKLSRPVDISLRDQYAHNNVKDMSNLMYFGVGAKWKPFKDKHKLMLRSNLICFWETTTLRKWDKKALLPRRYDPDGSSYYKAFLGEKSWKTGTRDYDWKKGDHVVGWMACEDASRMLGTELNFEAQYRPVPNCIFLFQLACFIPGQLYKDLDGQPNVKTVSGPKAADGVFGLGHDPVWRLATSLDYRF